LLFPSSPEDEEGRSFDEKQHEVEITQPFYMGVYAVTRGQFRQFVQDEKYHGGKKYQTKAEKDGSSSTWENPSFMQEDDHPVVYVSWHDTDAFCKWLSEKEGKKYRLPMEAEWEYSCRAGTTTRYAFGDEHAQLEDYAWYSKNSGGETHPVGEKKANAWGLYDMHGNVCQWCQDYHDPDYYKHSPRQDPQGPEARGSDAEHDVIRGGSCNYGRDYCRSASRHYLVPADRRYVGFRVVRVR
jgi:formylglycine-generating enzyme required for sulfatase activity